MRPVRLDGRSLKQRLLVEVEHGALPLPSPAARSARKSERSTAWAAVASMPRSARKRPNCSRSVR